MVMLVHYDEMMDVNLLLEVLVQLNLTNEHRNLVDQLYLPKQMLRTHPYVWERNGVQHEFVPVQNVGMYHHEHVDSNLIKKKQKVFPMNPMIIYRIDSSYSSFDLNVLKKMNYSNYMNYDMFGHP